MAKGGRIFRNKDGSVKSAHHLDPEMKGHKPDDIAQAHSYATGKNKDFVERSADENKALAAKPTGAPKVVNTLKEGK